MSIGSIKLSDIPLEERDYLRRISLKTLLMFLSTEIIAILIGVPIALVIVIGLSNLPHLLDVYLVPIVLVSLLNTSVILLPTKLFLARHIIKFILKLNLVGLYH